MKRALIYMVLGTALLLSSSLFVSSGWAAESDVISFASKRDGDRAIYSINPQGGILQRLVTDTRALSFPTWSPDGGSIAYGTNLGGSPDIYVMDVGTNTHRQLTFDGSRDLWPSWSPNGTWIAFVSERTGSRDIYTIDANGEHVGRLTNKGGSSRPAWAPDSRWIAFVSTQENEVGIPNSTLFVVNAEGKRLRRLARVSGTHCTWSPDGKQIAFIANAPAGGLEVFSIDVDGKNLRQLTELDPGSLIFQPVWSPSGEWIAYILTEVPKGLGLVPILHIFTRSVISVVNTVEVGRGKPIEATKGLVSLGSLDWVPDGFLSVSPSLEKRTTFWGRLKQTDK